MRNFALLLLSACSLVAQSATFTLTVDGTQPMTYAWLKNGTPIAGATASTLVLSPLKSTDTGVYAATALNAAGSATSNPVNLVVTAAAAPAPVVDFSKQYVEASLLANWEPPVGQWKTGFAVVPVKKTFDPGNHWDDVNSVYTVGPGEDGVYEALMTLRAADNPPTFVSVGITATLDNMDGAKTVWNESPGPVPAGNYVHWGMQAIVRRNYAAGAKIRPNVFISSAFPLWGFEFVLRRVP